MSGLADGVPSRLLSAFSLVGGSMLVLMQKATALRDTLVRHHFI